MGTELTTQQSTALTVSEAESMARMVAMSEHGTNALEKAAGTNMLKIMIGADMGVGPGAALRGIHIVKGKPELSGALWGAMIDNSPDYKFRVIESTAMTCSLEFHRKEELAWEMRGIETFTMEMAKTAGLAGSQTYKSYPANMLYWRAMSNGARKYCAGLTMGAAYAEGELSEGLENGIELPSEPVNVTPTERDTILMLKNQITAPHGPPHVEEDRERARTELGKLLGSNIDGNWEADQVEFVEKIIDTPVPGPGAKRTYSVEDLEKAARG